MMHTMKKSHFRNVNNLREPQSYWCECADELWIIAPSWRSRSNQHTLGIATHRTDGFVHWYKWGIWFEEQTGTPHKEFEKLSTAKAYLRTRLSQTTRFHKLTKKSDGECTQ